MRTRIAGFMLVVLVAALPLAMGADDMFAGTWKLNVAKSKFSPGPAPKGSTVTIEPGGKVRVHSVHADGQEMSWGYTANPNGAASIEGMDNGTVVEKRIDDRTIEHTWSFGGNSKMTGRAVLGKNGKSMKYTMTGTNEQGAVVNNVEVFEKQ